MNKQLAVVMLAALLSIPASVHAAGTPPVTTAPPTRLLVVDDDRAQCPKADFTTIPEAVNQARAGTHIEVCPGTYASGIVVDKAGLTIEVRGPYRSAHVVGTGEQAVEFGFAVLADNVTIEGFEISNFAGRFENTGIAVGGLLLPDDQVKLVPANNATIRYNNIRATTPASNEGFGIHIWQSAGARIEYNEIHHGNTGLVGDAASGARIEQNSFHDFGNWGVLGTLPGATIEHNLFYGNAEEGVRLFESGGATIEHNTFRDNFAGFFIQDSADVRFRQNTILRSGDGIVVVTSHGVKIDHNVVQSSGNGITTTESDAVTVEDNRVTGTLVGIAVQQTNNSRIAGNTTDNNETGIRVTESTGDTFRHNSAHHNTIVDLEWDGLGSHHFSKNRCDTATPSKEAWDSR